LNGVAINCIMAMASARSNRVINEEELFFLKLLENDTDTDSSCCSSVTTSEDDHERLYETTRALRRIDETPSPSLHPVNSREILRWKERDNAIIHRTRSEPANYFTSSSSTHRTSIMRSKDELGQMKQVRWADALVDVHTFISPRSHVLWKKLRKKMAKAAEAIKQDIAF